MRRSWVIVVSLLLATAASPATAAPPANDDVSSADPIEHLPATIETDTTEATSDTLAEPTSSCGWIGHSVWYRYTPAVDQMIYLTTVGSDFDAVVAIWLAGDPMREVHCNDDLRSGLEAEITTGLRAHTTYLIQAGGYAVRGVPADAFARSGRLVMSIEIPDEPLRFRPPSNDAREDAAPITSLPFQDLQEVATATADRDETIGCRDPSGWYPVIDDDGSGDGTVWYAYPAGPQRTISISVSSWGLWAWGNDHGIAVFDRASGDRVGCAGPGGGYERESLRFLARAGMEYLIQVTAYGTPYDGDTYPTLITIDETGGPDAAVGNLRVEPAAGTAPPALEISFDVTHTHGARWLGGWFATACPSGETRAGGCTEMARGEASVSAGGTQTVDARWVAEGAGEMTILVSLGNWDADASNDEIAARVTLGPSGVGAVVPCDPGPLLWWVCLQP